MMSTATAAVKAALAGAPVDQPPYQRQQRQADDDRDEDRRDPVGETLHLGLARLGVVHEPGDLCQLGVRPDPGRAHHETSSGVDGGADDRVAGSDLDRHRFPGQHRGVDGRRP